MIDGQETTAQTMEVAMPKRPWWRRLFEDERPGGVLKMTMLFRPASKHIWRTGIAIVEYPAGVETVQLSMETFLDGEPFVLADWPRVHIFEGAKREDVTP